MSKQMTPSSVKKTYQVSLSPSNIEVAGKSSIRHFSFGQDLAYIGSGPSPIVATMTQQAVVADALTRTGGLWFLSLTNVTAMKGRGQPLSDQSDAVHTIANGYKQPYGSVTCVPDSISRAPSQVPIAFPILPNANPAALSDGNITYPTCQRERNITVKTIAHPSITRSQIYNLPHSMNNFTLEWIELDSHVFQGSSIGAVVLLPRVDGNPTQKVMLCNLSAGWGTSSLSMRTVAGGSSAMSSEITHGDKRSTEEVSIKQTHVPKYQSNNDGISYHLPDYPRDLINISREWAQYLNPTLRGLNTTVINTLIQQEISSCSPRLSIERALVGLVVNGHAKTGTGSELQGNVRTKGSNGDQGLDGNYWISGKGNVFEMNKPNPEWVKFHVDSTLVGYGYNTFDVAPRLAIALLTMYCLLALGHMVYAGITGKTPSHLPRSWDRHKADTTYQASAPLVGIQ